MEKKRPPEFRACPIGFIAGILLLASLTACRGAAPPTSTEAPVPAPENTVLPAPDLDLAEQYLVVGVAEGEFVYLKSEPGGADLVASLPFGSTGIRPTGKAREVRNQFWIEVDFDQFRGWIPFTNLAEQYGELPAELVILAHQITAALRDRDYAGLETYIHPELCLRFTPYAYLNPDNRILCAQDLEQIDPDQIQLWGHYDGSGLPINLTFWEYHEKFVYDLDYYQAPIVGLDEEVSSGNSINNISEVYPDGLMVEYHFPGIDPQYGGLDWRSLRLVFVNQDDIWYLTAILHREWTI